MLNLSRELVEFNGLFGLLIQFNIRNDAMGRVTKARSVKSGMPPGTLVHIGKKSDRELRITSTEYNESSCKEEKIRAFKECFVLTDPACVSWINVEGLHDIEAIRQIGECQGLHPLVLEDVLNTDQRPKLEDYGEYLYIVLKSFRKWEGEDIVTEQTSIILGANFVISFQEGTNGDIFAPIKERIRNGKGKLRSMGADFLTYCLMDAIVDNYFTVLEEAEERIEAIEEEVVENPSQETVRKLHKLKREMIFLRKGVWPLREVLAAMTRRESKLITEPVVVFLRDVYDHTIQVIDIIEVSRDILAGMLDIYLSSMSNRLNEVMKFLTVIATIFMPLSFLTSMWGMNFKQMPELDLRWGYPMALGIMAVVAFSMVAWFRKKRWL
jgi:magnesium transporter